MKVIKPFFLGVLGGLGLALVLLVGFFLSPLRQDAYFRADPEMADIRSKLDRYQEWLAQTDLRIAENRTFSDSLQTAQGKAWRDYKGWRNRLGELARAHVRPTAEGFWPWTFSLRFWILPIGACLALLPGLLLAWRARSRFRPGRVKGPGKTARSQALSNFEDAIKKVARVSESERGNGAPLFPPQAPPPKAAANEPPTAAVPAALFVEPPKLAARPPRPGKNDPDTAPMPLMPDAPEPGDTGRETRFMQVGPGWGESLAVPGERIGNPASAPRLSMEDEDAAEAGKDEDGEETLGVMPPTTEVERVERRKDQVLKLARKGMTSSEISRRMRISQDQVEFIIRLRREKG